MVNDEIKKHISKYNVRLEQKNKGSDGVKESTFVMISDAEKDLPPITLHFVANEIYAVHFLNNQFFELPEETLWSILDSLLAGTYEIRSTSFRKKESVTIGINRRGVLPERVTNSDALEEKYRTLPKQFSRTTHRE